MPDPISSSSQGPGPAWYPDERASAGRENLDAEHASAYDRKEDADPAGEFAILKAHGLGAGSTIVDLGAGTGQFTLAAAAVAMRVVAVDVSPVMLQVLRAKIESLGISNVDVVQAGFLSYQHRGDPADFVYSRFALHHLPDFWKVLALQRISRILRPGGLLRLWDVAYHFDASEVEERMNAWCATLPRDVEEGWRRADIEEHIRDEHSTFTWLLESMLERTGFTIEQADYSPDGIFAKYVARAG